MKDDEGKMEWARGTWLRLRIESKGKSNVFFLVFFFFKVRPLEINDYELGGD